MTASKSITTVLEGVTYQLAEVKQLIEDQLGRCNESVKKLLNFFDLTGGKMLRPALVLYSGQICGKVTPDHIKTAAIVEMIHSATLLHDDVIDHGQIRRGRATVNSVFGNESAVLLGDFLLIKVFEMCRSLRPEVVSVISDTSSRMCQGEITQINQRGNFGINESQYYDIITEKTAKLFALSCQLGAMLSSANAKKTSRLYDFGLNTGIAFQISDDVADIIGQSEKTGKTQARDIFKKNLTLPMIHLLSQCSQVGKEAVKEKFGLANQNQDEVIDMLKAKGSIEYSRQAAKKFGQKGVEALNGFQDSQARQALQAIAKIVSE